MPEIRALPLAACFMVDVHEHGGQFGRIVVSSEAVIHQVSRDQPGRE